MIVKRKLNVRFSIDAAIQLVPQAVHRALSSRLVFVQTVFLCLSIKVRHKVEVNRHKQTSSDHAGIK